MKVGSVIFFRLLMINSIFFALWGCQNFFAGSSFAIPISCEKIPNETLSAVGGVPIVGQRQLPTTPKGGHICIWSSGGKGNLEITIQQLPPEGGFIKQYLSHPATWMNTGCQITSVTDDNQTIAIQGYTCDQVTKINNYLLSLSRPQKK